ncbi:hypothetical protein [Actimicrobium antarcticum]|uniref:Uncharacterized protein n=1 Tax=Actimicrobium antarcticum TaxID=1051899 RepID=A0ABP7T9S1_9BURK
MAHDDNESLEEIVDQYIAENNKLIADAISPLREWMKTQSAADRVDMTLSAVQRDMAARVFKRCTHTGKPVEEASDTELESFYRDALLLRDLVPPELASLQRNIQNAGINIEILHTFRKMTLTELVRSLPR